MHLDVSQPDLSSYRKGNTGIDYVHRFESGRPGPHVLVNALTHGNEICGMVAVKHLLDSEVRPAIGTLTLSFANVEAYNAFDPARPYDNRQLVHNLNRIWTPEILDGQENSPEICRARELRPALDAADHLLDIHSTRADVAPFWVYPPFARNTELASAIQRVPLHLEMSPALSPAGATGLTQYGHYGNSFTRNTGVVIECGQHFKPESSRLATEVVKDYLAYFGLITTPRDEIEPHAPPRRFELLTVCMVRTTEFSFVRPLTGFEVFSRGELIATDGDDEIRSPCDHCTIFMPTQEAIVGREAVYLTRPL
ncbi:MULTISPECIES: succinylglutamate desuccinylase/aspartoacylase family protein [Pandoraea]|uniref:succinylglutamate desuccinylase/aspartoacylase domain-containing protein n=1 Tax=Pandoraea TaxID=93217 RepID=UPI001F5C1529|nr:MULTISPECIES: succinylglutamate desuccinylase/aspartoacylase family protein [Pandoraea]MCI3208633.1 succinylglutamate desuccinylase [Pandoraea sp. LA3]MDN4586662.1 succinylglutamate desuccinylase [Pandoraea capi]